MDIEASNNRNWRVGVDKLIYKNSIPYKHCNSCHRLLKSSSEFFRVQTANKIGFYATCKKCMSKKPIKPIKKHFDLNGDLFCFVCEKYHHPEFFCRDKNYKLRGYKSYMCRDCKSKKSKKYFNSKIELSKTENIIDFYLKRLLARIKAKSKNDNNFKKTKYNNFDLDIDYLKYLYDSQNGLCAISGIKMEFTVGQKLNLYNLSIDRINSEIGYIKGNVQFVCCHINMMKGALNKEDLINLCKKIIQHNEK